MGTAGLRPPQPLADLTRRESSVLSTARWAGRSAYVVRVFRPYPVNPVNQHGMPMVDSAGLDVLTEDECLQQLAKAPVGRIVFTDRALPAILPVNFAVLDRAVIIRTATRSRLAIAGTNTVVAFEADEFSTYPARSGWSVVAVGEATHVTDPAELAAIQRLGLRPWAPGHKEYYLRISIEIITGRRLLACE